MPWVDDEIGPKSMTTHAKLAVERAAADEGQKQTLTATRNHIISLSIATIATGYRNFAEGSKDLEEALKMGRDLASKTGLDFDAIAYDQQLKEIKRLSWSQYSQEQFEGKVESYIEKEISRLDEEEKKKDEKRRRGGLENIREVEEMAAAVGLTFESGG